MSKLMIGVMFAAWMMAGNGLLAPGLGQPLKTSIQGESYVGKRFGTIAGQRWGDFEGFECKILGPANVFNHIGDGSSNDNSYIDDYGRRKQHAYNLNVGRALETLRRELPLVFAVSNVDFSIFSAQITVADGSRNKMVMQKSLYVAAVKSLRMASAISSIYPSMNVRKIEYIEDSATIQCLVDVVLPDSVRVDGQAVWEGMFYFGLDEEGLINTHIFDRKITTMRPKPITVSSYPWLRASSSSWSSELLGGVVRPERGLIAAMLAENSSEEQENNELGDESVNDFGVLDLFAI